MIYSFNLYELKESLNIKNKLLKSNIIVNYWRFVDFLNNFLNKLLHIYYI